MITLKLLSVILNENVLSVDFAKEGDRGQSLSKNQLIIVCVKEGQIPHRYFLNIYELAFKCKEWAFSNGYEFVVRRNIIELFDLNKQVYVYGEFELDNGFNPDAIFKACEWILEDQDTKNVLV